MSQYPELKEQIVFDNVILGMMKNRYGFKDFNMDIKKNHKYAILVNLVLENQTVHTIKGRLSEKQGLQHN